MLYQLSYASESPDGEKSSARIVSAMGGVKAGRAAKDAGRSDSRGKFEEAAGPRALTRCQLPLPDRAGSDRDELLCFDGFVDRAYSVFFVAER